MRRFLAVLCLIQLTAAVSGCGGGDTHVVPQQAPPPASVTPTAAFVAPASATVLDAVALDASGSAAADGSALQYVWDFGAGQRGGGVKIAHVFAAAGDSTVTLTVVDGAGRSATLAKTISIVASSVTTTSVSTQILVKGIDGTALDGVTVSPASAGSAPSDANGKMTVAVNAGASTSLKFSKTGFADQFLSIATPAGSGTDGYLEVTMHTRDAALTLADASAGGLLTGRDGATISVPASAFLDASGAAVTGAIQVAVTPIDVTQPGGGGFPGGFEGVQADGTKTSIVSAGVNEFVPTANGAPIQLAPGKAATITIPIYAAMKLDGTLIAAGDVIPLWSLDEATGIWIQEGTGTVVAATASPSGLAMQALVTHLSWWNTDFGFNPYGPEPGCEAQGDTGLPGSINHLAAASICNMLAEIDRGSGDGASGTAAAPSVDKRALTRQQSRAPAAATVLSAKILAFSREYTVPVAGGQIIAVPPGVDVRLTAYALNGTWTGTAVVHGDAFVTAPVTVMLHPVGQIAATPEAITLPFDDSRSVAAPATAQFTFTAPAQSVARITINPTTGSTFTGTLRLLQGTTVVGTATIAQGELEQVVAYLPAAGTYTIAADIDRAAAFRLQADLEPGDAQVQPITLPFNGERALLPAATATYSFSSTAAQFVRVVVAVPANGTGVNTPFSGEVRLMQGTTVLASAPLSGASAQLLAGLPANGSFTIEITGAAGSSYLLGVDLEGTTLAEVLSVPTDVTRSIEAEFAYRGSFTLTAATTIYLNTRHVTGDMTDVKLAAADGTILFEAPPTANETDATNSFVATLQPGTYTILVAPQNAQAATERITLATTSWAPVAPTLPVPGVNQTVDLVMDRNGKPVVGFVSFVSVNGHQSHNLQLRRWTGTAWETVGADMLLDSPCELTDGASFAFDTANNPVVMYAKTSAADNSTFFTVHRWNGTAWAAVGANDGQLPFTSAAAAVCARPTSTLVGADDQPVVVYMTASSSTAGPVLLHFDGASWVGYATPTGDFFGDGTSEFEARFDPAGKLWMVYSAGVSDPAGTAQRFNTGTHVWDTIGGTFPQVGTYGLQQPRVRFDSAGKPVVAWLAAVGVDLSAVQGVAVHRFDGTAWQTTGGHLADATSNGGLVPDPAFVLFNDQAVVAWGNTQQGQSFDTVVVQQNTAAGWAPINGGIGQLPQYSHAGVSFADAHNARLATDGTDVYLSVIAVPASSSSGVQGAVLTLLKKVGP